MTASADGFRGLVTIVSYDLMSKMAEEAQKKKFNVIIADEAHYLKSADTKRVKVPCVAHQVLLLAHSLVRRYCHFSALQSGCV